MTSARPRDQQTHLDVELLPGLDPEQQSWDAGHDVAEKTVDQPRLVETLGILVDQAAGAPIPTAT